MTRIKGEGYSRAQLTAGGVIDEDADSAFLFAVCIAALAPIGMLTAHAKAQIRECVASPSRTQGHWSWRLIDGRKCWYAGKTMISNHC
jgi:hypothetical protein